MIDLTQQKQKANELRKAKSYGNALPLYRTLWKENGDEFDGAGLLNCLRKLELFEEAIALADELIDRYPDFNWCRIEVIWTYIQGILDKFDDGENLETITDAAKKIMNLNPDGLAKKKVVFKVLKSAKASNDWETINEWVTKIDPDSLSNKPIADEVGRGAWSDQSLWYNYRLRGFIESENTEEAIVMVDEILERFPKQRKFFLRLKALAYHHLGNLNESEKIYQSLCKGYKTDWWLLHEYANVVSERGRKQEALKLMAQAAVSHSKLESMVSLFVNIGMLCKEMGKNEEARAHLVLCKYVRKEKGWTVPESIINTVNDLNKTIGNNNEPSSLKEALSICRSEWSKLSGKKNDLKNLSYKNRKVKKGLIDKVSLGRSNRPFCFIIAKDEQFFFCYKSDLPRDIMDGDEVTFDAIPSFDKKKNKESWKASNIRQCT